MTYQEFLLHIKHTCFPFSPFSLHIKTQIKINNYSHTYQCTYQANFNAFFVFTYHITYPQNTIYQVTYHEKRSTCHLHFNCHIKLELHINGHINDFVFSSSLRWPSFTYLNLHVFLNQQIMLHIRTIYGGLFLHSHIFFYQLTRNCCFHPFLPSLFDTIHGNSPLHKDGNPLTPSSHKTSQSTSSQTLHIHHGIYKYQAVQSSETL